MSLLEAFDAARHAQHIAPAYPPVVRTKASDMHLGSMQRRKQYVHERVGCAEAMNDGSFLMMPLFLLLAREFMKGKGNIHRRERTCVAIDGRIGRLRCGLYILSSLPLVS